ncbi:MAG: ABC transporter ATP-binding protein/permease [Bacillus sp. (in: Bacteria)]|nr:ABC transporter ATP-binding protein/permease [Bacillus sp. (in: firmicutes)]MCM1427785.1 ABC transporter ATP-binding protein/permease [Eubacterium sp.]
MDEARIARLEKKYGRKEAAMPEAGRGPGPRPGRGPGSGPRGARMPGAKPQNAGKTIQRLFSYIGKDKWKLVIFILCIIIYTVASLAGSYLLRPVINNLVSENGSRETLFHSLITMGCIFAVGIIAQYLQSRIIVSVSQNALKKLRDDLFHKIENLPVRFYDTNNHGDIMSRFTNDVDTVGEMLNNTVNQVISGAINIVGTFILMVYTNIYLTIITVVMAPLMICAGRAVAGRSRKYYKQQQAALGTLNGYIEETVTGQKVVKVFCHEEIAEEEFSYLNDDLCKKQINAQFFGGIMGPVMGNLSQVSYSLTACIGGILCVLKGFDLGGLTIFVNYSRQFSRPINEISMQVNTIFSALAGAERVFDVMDREPEPADELDAVSIVEKDGKFIYQTSDSGDYVNLNGTEMKGAVTVDHVTFGYVPEKTILKDISLYAKPGQKIAFVGSTGAGKTTITNLINRFYDIDEGKILIDGIDIKKIKRDDLRKSIAMVLQDTHLFTGTVRENIRYGRLDATDDEVEAAAKMASAHSFIMRLEHGYDTMLEGDGANLSQGQRQLLNIARASISKAPILILDEATSSVDTRTEKHIEHGMDRLMAQRTTLVIAHRLSTVRNANAIMVLENGEIIERGDHDDLLAMHGRYYNLYTGLSELE